MQPRRPPLRVSMVIPSYNEGAMIARTAQNLHATMHVAGEVIVVDDSSTDGSCDAIDTLPGVRVLRPTRRLGASAARNFGAQNARGETLVFCDAHILASDDWYRLVDRELRRSGVGIVGPVYREMNAPEIKGYGFNICDAGLNWDWLDQQADTPYRVPMLGGFFLAMRASTFWNIGGFDEGFGTWGMEDLEFVLRAWLFGYDCLLHPQIEVDHLSRDVHALPDYQTDWSCGLRNVLRVAMLHLGPHHIERVLASYASDPQLPAAIAGLVSTDVWQRRASFEAQRSRTDEEFIDTFAIRM